MLDYVRAAYLFPESIGGVDFDTLISEEHGAGVALTEYPVERGAPITEHSYVQPRTLSITVVKSAQVAFLSPLSQEQAKLHEFYSALEDLRYNRQTFDVVTALTTYRNLTITSLTCIRERNSATIARVAIQCREVVLVDVFDIDKYDQRYAQALGVRDRAAATVERGDVEPETVAIDSAEEKAVKSTTGYRLLETGGNLVRGLFGS